MGKQATRMTRQRAVILDELRKSTSHPTAQELCRAVRKRMPRISLGTVYRNLDLLVGQGEVVQLEPSSARCERRYDGNVAKPHYHIECVRCGRVGDVDEGGVRGVRVDGMDTDGFVVLACDIHFKGLCTECLNSEGTAG